MDTTSPPWEVHYPMAYVSTSITINEDGTTYKFVNHFVDSSSKKYFTEFPKVALDARYFLRFSKDPPPPVPWDSYEILFAGYGTEDGYCIYGQEE